MNYFLNEVILPYQTGSGKVAIVSIIILIILLAINFFLDKDASRFKKVLEIIIFILLSSAVLAISLDVVEKKDWKFVFKNNGVYLYDFKGREHYVEATLIKSVTYSELTPYFDYDDGYVELELKISDGTTFYGIESGGSSELVNVYKEIHEKNPALIERTVVVSGQLEFERFKERLNK